MASRGTFLGASLAALLLTGGMIAAPAAHASQIFIQQSTTATSPAGGDPNIITDLTAFGIGVAGNHTLNSPLLVIVGAYNGGGTPAISYSGCATPSACPLATVGTYGLTSQTASFTSGKGEPKTAFAALGLSAGGSESFVNWSKADVANGFAAPTSFTLTAFAVPASLAQNSTITVDASGTPRGSFIIAYSCEGSGGTSACSGGNIGETIFTNTGLADPTPTPVPEPGSLALLGTALLGLGAVGFARRRRS